MAQSPMTSRKILKYSYPTSCHTNILATNDKFLCYRVTSKTHKNTRVVSLSNLGMEHSSLIMTADPVDMLFHSMFANILMILEADGLFQLWKLIPAKGTGENKQPRVSMVWMVKSVGTEMKRIKEDPTDPYRYVVLGRRKAFVVETPRSLQSSTTTFSSPQQIRDLPCPSLDALPHFASSHPFSDFLDASFVGGDSTCLVLLDDASIRLVDWSSKQTLFSCPTSPSPFPSLALSLSNSLSHSQSRPPSPKSPLVLKPSPLVALLTIKPPSLQLLIELSLSPDPLSPSPSLSSSGSLSLSLDQMSYEMSVSVVEVETRAKAEGEREEGEGEVRGREVVRVKGQRVLGGVTADDASLRLFLASLATNPSASSRVAVPSTSWSPLTLRVRQIEHQIVIHLSGSDHMFLLDSSPLLSLSLPLQPLDPSSSSSLFDQEADPLPVLEATRLSFGQAVWGYAHNPKKFDFAIWGAEIISLFSPSSPLSFCPIPAPFLSLPPPPPVSSPSAQTPEVSRTPSPAPARSPSPTPKPAPTPTQAQAQAQASDQTLIFPTGFTGPVSTLTPTAGSAAGLATSFSTFDSTFGDEGFSPTPQGYPPPPVQYHPSAPQYNQPQPQLQLQVPLNVNPYAISNPSFQQFAPPAQYHPQQPQPQVQPQSQSQVQLQPQVQPQSQVQQQPQQPKPKKVEKTESFEAAPPSPSPSSSASNVLGKKSMESLGLPSSFFDEDQLRRLADKLGELGALEKGGAAKEVSREVVDSAVRTALAEQLEKAKPSLQRIVQEKAVGALQSRLDSEIENRLVAHTNALFDELERRVADSLRSLPPPPRVVSSGGPLPSSSSSSSARSSAPAPSPVAELEACLYQREAAVLMAFCLRTHPSAVFANTADQRPLTPNVLLSLAQQLTFFLTQAAADEKAARAFLWLQHSADALSSSHMPASAQETIARFWPAIQQRLRVVVVERIADRAFLPLTQGLVSLLQQLGA